MSTSGRSHPSRTSSSMEFSTRSVPRETKSRCWLLVSWAVCFGPSSAASHTELNAHANTASFRIIDVCPRVPPLLGDLDLRAFLARGLLSAAGGVARQLQERL